MSRRFNSTRVTVNDLSELKVRSDTMQVDSEPPAKEPRRAHTWSGGDTALPGIRDEPASPRAASQMNALLEAISLAQKAREDAPTSPVEDPPQAAPPAAAHWFAPFAPAPPNYTAATLTGAAYGLPVDRHGLTHTVSTVLPPEASPALQQCAARPYAGCEATAPSAQPAIFSEDKSSDDEKSNRCAHSRPSRARSPSPAPMVSFPCASGPPDAYQPPLR